MECQAHFSAVPFSIGSFSSIIRALYCLELELFSSWPHETTINCELVYTYLLSFLLLLVSKNLERKAVKKKKKSESCQYFCLLSGIFALKNSSFSKCTLERAIFWHFLQLLYLFLQRQVGLIQASLSQWEAKVPKGKIKENNLQLLNKPGKYRSGKP